MPIGSCSWPGQQSRGHPANEVNIELGKKLGLDVIELPGGHVGYLTQPEEFARDLCRSLGELLGSTT